MARESQHQEDEDRDDECGKGQRYADVLAPVGEIVVRRGARVDDVRQPRHDGKREDPLDRIEAGDAGHADVGRLDRPQARFEERMARERGSEYPLDRRRACEDGAAPVEDAERAAPAEIQAAIETLEIAARHFGDDGTAQAAAGFVHGHGDGGAPLSVVRTAAREIDGELARLLPAQRLPEAALDVGFRHRSRSRGCAHLAGTVDDGEMEDARVDSDISAHERFEGRPVVPVRHFAGFRGHGGKRHRDADECLLRLVGEQGDQVARFVFGVARGLFGALSRTDGEEREERDAEAGGERHEDPFEPRIAERFRTAAHRGRGWFGLCLLSRHRRAVPTRPSSSIGPRRWRGTPGRRSARRPRGSACRHVRSS